MGNRAVVPAAGARQCSEGVGVSRKRKLIKIEDNTAVQLLLMTPMPLLPPSMMRGILAMQPELGEVTRRKHYRWPAGRASRPAVPLERGPRSATGGPQRRQGSGKSSRTGGSCMQRMVYE